MGCDIHPHIEVKCGAQWVHYSTPRLDRNYRLFSRICGVRGEEQPIAEPRGFPADISEITRSEWEWNDGHSVTWLNKEELMGLIAWHGSWLDGDKCDVWLTLNRQWGNLDALAERYEDIRLVCWFDN